MFVLSRKRHLVKYVTVYCFLSKTIQPINPREVNNIARIRQIFGTKTKATTRIWRLCRGLTVNINWDILKFSMCEILFFVLLSFLRNLVVACKNYYHKTQFSIVLSR